MGGGLDFLQVFVFVSINSLNIKSLIGNLQ